MGPRGTPGWSRRWRGRRPVNGDGDPRDPRVLARELPDEALIIALVHEEIVGDDGAAAADTVAMELGRRREHTLLTSAAAGLSPLDLLLGGADGEGLPGALEGRARLTDIAIQPVDRPFVYLPAGRRPEQMTALLGGDLFASFVERIRERGGTLLLLLPEVQLRDAAVCDLLDGYVELGDGIEEKLADLPVYGRLRLSGYDESTPEETDEATSDSPPDVEMTGETMPARPPDVDTREETAESFAGAGPGFEATGEGLEETSAEAGKSFEFAPLMEAEEEIGQDAQASSEMTTDSDTIESDTIESETPSWRRHRATAAFPGRRVAIGAGAIAVLLVGWWLIASALGGPEGAEAEPTMSSPTSSAPQTDSPDPDPTVPALTEAEADSAARLAPELPYSVLVASYAARSDAEDRLARLRQGPGGPYFVVPTLIRGALYHRVFAGARPDAESARDLMGELVESGRKDDASAWHIRPARLAYLLGAYGTPTEARARQEAATAAGLPAYTLSAALDEGRGPDSVFQVYAGAYESPVAARALIAALEGAAEDAELVDRRGRLP